MKKTKRWIWHSLIIHTVLPAGLTIVLFAASMLFFALPQITRSIYDNKKQLLRDLNANAYGFIVNYYQRYQNGEFTEPEAQQLALQTIRQMRYGPEGKDYYWINSIEPRMVMHPFSPELEGKSPDQTPNVKRLYLKYNEAISKSENNAAYVEYNWQWKDNPNKIVPKISYVRLFKPWGWVLGTGMYLEDTKIQINSITANIRIIFIGIFLIVSLISSYLIYHGFLAEKKRRYTEKKLQLSLERFRTVMDSLRSVVYVADMQTHELLFQNKYCIEHFGEGIGQPCWKILQNDQSQACDFCTNDRLLDESGTPYPPYTWEFNNTKTHHWFECHDQAIRWIDGHYVRMEIASDITARKTAEKDREILLRNLALKNEELQSIVYITSHDLRSPIINIRGFSAELERDIQDLTQFLNEQAGTMSLPRPLDDSLSESIPTSLDFIKINTEKMQSLVDALLKLSRIGTSKLEIQTVDMNKVIEKIAQECHFQLNEQNGTIEFDQLPCCRGDQDKVHQLFTNLIENAIKYRHPDRPPHIRITSAKTKTDVVEYAVTDNGIGIEPEHTTKIFELFQQLDPQNKSGGAGLGLTIVKRIVDICNGSIRVMSKPDHGTTFYVALPEAPSPDPKA